MRIEKYKISFEEYKLTSVDLPVCATVVSVGNYDNYFSTACLYVTCERSEPTEKRQFLCVGCCGEISHWDEDYKSYNSSTHDYIYIGSVQHGQPSSEVHVFEVAQKTGN